MDLKKNENKGTSFYEESRKIRYDHIVRVSCTIIIVVLLTVDKGLGLMHQPLNGWWYGCLGAIAAFGPRDLLGRADEIVGMYMKKKK